MSIKVKNAELGLCFVISQLKRKKLLFKSICKLLDSHPLNTCNLIQNHSKMTKLIKHSKENINVKRDATNYTATSNDLKGHLQGIDNALGNNPGGGNSSQDNFVRNIYIDINYLNIGESSVITADMLNEYFSSLSDEEKTILDTDSKTNIVIYRNNYAS